MHLFVIKVLLKHIYIYIYIYIYIIIIVIVILFGGVLSSHPET